MQKQDLVNALIEHGYNLTKMSEYGAVTFSKIICIGDREYHKDIILDQDCNGIYVQGYKYVMGGEPFGDIITQYLELLNMADGMLLDNHLHEFVL